MPHRKRFHAAAVLFATCLSSLPSSSVLAEQARQVPLGEREVVKVDVYEGPQPYYCPVTTDDQRPHVVQRDHKVDVHFTVTIDETSEAGDPGRQIESSHDHGVPPSFVVGRNMVIPGLDHGLLGLCKGSKARIIIPPHLAYGRRGVPEQGLPGGVTLRYDVEILDIQPTEPTEPGPNGFVKIDEFPEPEENVFAKIDTNKDGKLDGRELEAYFDEIMESIDYPDFWSKEDKDRDGFISWEEFNGPKGSEPPPREHGQHQQQQRQQQKNNAKADSNTKKPWAQVKEELFHDIAGDDGKISKSELYDYFVSIGQQEHTAGFWQESNWDRDEYLDLQEWMGDDTHDTYGRGSEL